MSPAGRFERQVGHGLAHRDHPGLEQDGRDADRVRPGHPRVLGLFHDDVSRVGFRPRRGEDEIAVGRGIAAGLPEHELPQPVGVEPEVLPLLEHRPSGHVPDTADDDAAGLAAGVGIDRPDHSLESHGRTSIPSTRDAVTRLKAAVTAPGR